MNSSNTVFDAKRLIGRKFQDPAVQADMTHWPFTVQSGPGDKPQIKVTYKGEEKTFFAEEVSSMVLQKMKEISEAFIGKEVKNAVVAIQFRRLAKESGIDTWERYVDGSRPDRFDVAAAWVRDRVDPDA